MTLKIQILSGLIFMGFLCACRGQRNSNYYSEHLNMEIEKINSDYKLVKFGSEKGQWSDSIIVKRRNPWFDDLKLFASSDSSKIIYILDMHDVVRYIGEHDFRFVVRKEYIDTGHGIIWVDSTLFNDNNLSLTIDLYTD